jgi:chemotaxis protein MotB
MRGMARLTGVGVLAVVAVMATGCNMVPRTVLGQSQARTMALYQQNQALAMERDSHLAENQSLKQQLADNQSLVDTLKQRLANSQSTEQKLRDSFTGMQQPVTSPLSDSATEAFKNLSERYPGFEFDPATGVSKFNEHVLFDIGSAELKPEAMPVLKEFAGILNSGTAQELNVLVVGHTDDRLVAKSGTKAKHPDNWYLSAHRSIAVRTALGQFGLKEGRFGVAGYGPYQPLKPNTNEANRTANRRVEIFVLAPNASMAGWDGESLVK